MSAAVAGATARGLASPSDTVRVACIGVRAQGRSHISKLLPRQDVEIAAICDVDESILDARIKMVEDAGRKRPARYTDYRKLLEDKSIDAVTIATPNHTHSLIAIAACQAGKDVYVEKPCSHNIFESRQLVAAAKKYKRVVQHGTQSRSSAALQEAARTMESMIGEVYMARGLCFKRRDTIGREPDSPVPPGVHYDLWLGPAPKRPFSKNRFHYNWHWNWEYGNGDLGNQGIHEVDICRWILNVKYPVKVNAMGGHFMFDDDQNTPNTLVATFEFNEGGKKKLMVFEVRHWITNHEATIGEDRGKKSGNTIGNIFYGSKGYMSVHGYTRFKTWMGREQQPGPTLSDDGDHWANFIQVVKSRKLSELNAPIEEGALSTELMHLANISYRVGRTLHIDPVTRTVKGDPEANRLFTRDYRAPFIVPQNV